MEDIININEYVRTDNGIIGKYVKYRGIEDAIETNNKWIGLCLDTCSFLCECILLRKI